MPRRAGRGSAGSDAVLERYRMPIQLALDLLAWAVGLYVAMVLRFD